MGGIGGSDCSQGTQHEPKVWTPETEPRPEADGSFSKRRLQARKNLARYSLVHPFTLTVLSTLMSLWLSTNHPEVAIPLGKVAVFDGVFGHWSSPEVWPNRFAVKIYWLTWL